MIIVGLDLAGKEANPTGFCILTDEGVKKAKAVYTDNEILREIEKAGPDLICIDAPLSLPEQGMYREGEKEMIKAGFRPLSPRFPGMMPLVKRAAILTKLLGKKYSIIEVFPRAAEKVLGLHKNSGVGQDEYDSMLCALTGKYFLEKKFRSFGPEGIIVPEL